MRNRNVVLTGLPRGGTTLTCRLLNQLPDTVALHEPIAPGRFVNAEDDQAVLEGMERYFRRMRRMIRGEKVAVSKNVGGKITDNAYEQSRSRRGLRPPTGGKGAEKGKISLDRDHIIRYEELVSSGGRALSAINPAAKTLNEPLSSQNLNALYDHGEMRELGSRLLRTEGAYWRFYTRESVERLLEGIR